MGSREKKGSTEDLEIQVKERWGPGTPAIPEGAANVLQMGARTDARCRATWSVEPPIVSTFEGVEPSWAICSVGCGRRGPEKLGHETSVRLGESVSAALGKKSKWQIQGTARRAKFTTAVGQALWHFPHAHNSGR